MTVAAASLLRFVQAWLNSRAAQRCEGAIVIGMICFLAWHNRNFRRSLSRFVVLLGIMVLIATGGYFVILGIIHAACSIIMSNLPTFP